LQQQNQQHQQQQHSQGARVREKITPIMRARLEGRARQTERKSYHHVGQGMLVMLPLLLRLLLLLLHANATAGVGGEDLPLMLQWLMSGYLAHTLLKQKCSFIFLAIAWRAFDAFAAVAHAAAAYIVGEWLPQMANFWMSLTELLV